MGLSLCLPPCLFTSRPISSKRNIWRGEKSLKTCLNKRAFKKNKTKYFIESSSCSLLDGKVSDDNELLVVGEKMQQGARESCA